MRLTDHIGYIHPKSSVPSLAWNCWLHGGSLRFPDFVYPGCTSLSTNVGMGFPKDGRLIRKYLTESYP